MLQGTTLLLQKHMSPFQTLISGAKSFFLAHTHIFLHAYSETPSLNQMPNESLVEGVIRAVNHWRTTLLAGYTTYRDLGTEGLQDADTNVQVPSIAVRCLARVFSQQQKSSPLQAATPLLQLYHFHHIFR